MIKTLWEGLRKITGFQIVVSFLVIFCGTFIMPRVGITQSSIDIFYILVLGASVSSIMLIVMIILLYFENRRDALITSGIFFISNIIFTQVTIMLGMNFYGFGYFLSSLVSLVFALLRLNSFLKDLDYHTICTQQGLVDGENKMFSKLIDKFYKL